MQTSQKTLKTIQQSE